jgi:hypothetical protein
MSSILKAVEAVDWSQYETAYGVAKDVPSLLIRLTSDDLDVATAASHELWCGLCHQHAYLSDAALPAYSILFSILQVSSDEIAVEILDIILGFSSCSNPKVSHQSDLRWIKDLRTQLKENIPYFVKLKDSKNSDIKEFSLMILDQLEATF